MLFPFLLAFSFASFVFCDLFLLFLTPLFVVSYILVIKWYSENSLSHDCFA